MDMATYPYILFSLTGVWANWLQFFAVLCDKPWNL